MDEKDSYSFFNGLLKDARRQIRRIRNYLLSSYHLSGILIDSFVYQAIGDWRWLRSDEIYGNHSGPCEGVLLDCYRSITSNGACASPIYAPGSGMAVDTSDWETLGKALEIIAQ